MAQKPQKVLVIGSGPIVIGQAAEFDYAGAQACKSLREEGVTTVLVNSNPATIMTDEGIADIVHIEPAYAAGAGANHRTGAAGRHIADPRWTDGPESRSATGRAGHSGAV